MIVQYGVDVLRCCGDPFVGTPKTAAVKGLWVYVDHPADVCLAASLKSYTLTINNERVLSCQKTPCHYSARRENKWTCVVLRCVLPRIRLRRRDRRGPNSMARLVSETFLSKCLGHRLSSDVTHIFAPRNNDCVWAPLASPVLTRYPGIEPIAPSALPAAMDGDSSRAHTIPPD